MVLNRTKQIKIQRLFRLSMNKFMVLNTPYQLWVNDVYIGCFMLYEIPYDILLNTSKVNGLH